jgi:hypothetical protein
MSGARTLRRYPARKPPSRAFIGMARIFASPAFFSVAVHVLGSLLAKNLDLL